MATNKPPKLNLYVVIFLFQVLVMLILILKQENGTLDTMVPIILFIEVKFFSFFIPFQCFNYA